MNFIPGSLAKKQTRMENRNIRLKKILIIKMSALGDLFMALPHVEAILAHHADDSVWILTSPPFDRLFTNHPRLKVVVLDRNRRFGSKSTWGRVLWVKRELFDVIYDLQGNRTSRLLVRFSGAPKRVGTQPKPVYNCHPDNPYTKTTEQNVFDRLNETLASAGLPAATPGCTLYPPRSDVDAVSAWKHQNRIEDGKYALMHAGSSRKWPSKRWPKEKFSTLAAYIEAAGIRCVWLGGKEDREVNRYLSRYSGIDATDRFNILQLYLLGKDACFAVTNDSGPMHILAAAGIPVYGLFGPTNWVRSHAAGQRERVIFNRVDCSPCFSGTCPPSKQHACLEEIVPEAVFSEIEKHSILG